MRSALVLTAALAIVLVAPGLAHDDDAAPSPTFASDLLSSYDGAMDKIVQLAEAIPKEQFGWRPAEGVRSVSEVLMHVAAAHYVIAAHLGGPPPPDNVRELEQESDKAKVLAQLRASVAPARAAIEGTTTSPAAVMDEGLELFGMPMSRRRAALLLNDHAHEHLGQLIAYARAIGVAPPWSRVAGNS